MERGREGEGWKGGERERDGKGEREVVVPPGSAAGMTNSYETNLRPSIPHTMVITTIVLVPGHWGGPLNTNWTLPLSVRREGVV